MRSYGPLEFSKVNPLIPKPFATLNNLFGRSSGDKRLSPRIDRYVGLADVRNVNKEGKGDLRMSLYDTSSGNSLVRKDPVTVATNH
jgi:hypothetical protein